MATSKPRITVALDPADYELIRQLSELNGESMSSIVAGLVGASEPILRRIVDAGNAFRSMSDAARADVGALLEDAEREVIPRYEELAQQLASVMDAATAAATADQDPRLVTRGSRPPTPHPPASETGH